jgi:hypothetical protein
MCSFEQHIACVQLLCKSANSCNFDGGVCAVA